MRLYVASSLKIDGTEGPNMYFVLSLKINGTEGPIEKRYWRSITITCWGPNVAINCCPNKVPLNKVSYFNEG